ncbi:hypothetical protein ERO13_A11G046900v2 [Gossypium hirsutum]|uniref:Fungal lipase-type domain-containing protein n=2 Tax=Gossypium TaxID=3633 RepID=A0A2P5Y0E6_GOSBA|nr:triacylglycerol lipase OBL1-like [Gossypium hirsutum]KAB2055663.1 hypothetical protein ES319_A11G052800v1 [Gossypium barbadense]KAG4173240.1 hypothetical protein ERO13_A11G046900v2 [Gossypium hirsutum]PPS09067.1 hypothetical protein GOBAR_AA11588 [Gossypium barbadense]
MEAKPSKKDLCTNYLLINPKEASLFDIFSVLFSRNLKKRKFIESSFEELESFLYRFLIVISALIQKFLHKISMPMAMIGRTIVFLLNFFYINGGFFGLIRNIMQVRVVIPDKKAAAYLSFIGFTDTRMELDITIKYGNAMYYPALSIMAGKAAYNNAAYNQALIEGQWKMEFLGYKDYWNDFLGRADTQVVMFRDKSVDHDTIVVCFRGTQPFNTEDWCSDVDLSWYEFPHIGKVHSGFLKALGMQNIVGWAQEVDHDSAHPPRRAPLAYYDIRDTLRDLLQKNPEAKFIVTGHSLGGALAILFPGILFYHDEELLLERMEGVYTFGQPRVGDEAFGQYMEENFRKNRIEYYRYVYCNDMVPRIPSDGLFKHFGTCVYYNSEYKPSIIEEEPYKNYLSIWGSIDMRRNAIYELIRSFIMLTKYGEAYKEGWLLFFIRIFGLMIPGVPAHCAQDYVNSTRLGSLRHLHFYHFHHKKNRS